MLLIHHYHPQVGLSVSYDCIYWPHIFFQQLLKSLPQLLRETQDLDQFDQGSFSCSVYFCTQSNKINPGQNKNDLKDLYLSLNIFEILKSIMISSSTNPNIICSRVSASRKSSYFSPFSKHLLNCEKFETGMTFDKARRPDSRLFSASIIKIGRIVT